MRRIKVKNFDFLQKWEQNVLIEHEALTLRDSSGHFCPFLSFFTFHLVIILAVLQFLTWILQECLILMNIFKIQCQLLLKGYYTQLTHFVPFGDPRAKNVHAQKTAIKSSYINIFFWFFLHKSLKQLQPCSKLSNIQLFWGF